MPEPFDAYRKWLGISPAEQPPHHYRLLGVAPFEDDPDTIANAADRQMAHLRTFQTGPHSAESQKLLNEVAAVRVCLLDPMKKAAYDEQLRRRFAVQQQPSFGATAAEAGAPRVAPLAATRQPLPPAAATLNASPASNREINIHAEPAAQGRPRPNRRRQPTWLAPVAVAVVIVLLCAAGYALLGNGGKKTPVAAAEGPPNKPTRPEQRPIVQTGESNRGEQLSDKHFELEGTTANAGAVRQANDSSDEKTMDEAELSAKAPTAESKPISTPEQPRKEKMASGPPESPRDQQPANAPATGLPSPPPENAAPSEPARKPVNLGDLLIEDEEPRILPPIKRPPLPDPKTLQAATERAFKLFGGEAKNAKTSPAQLALARKMFARARWTRDEPDVRYVLLRQAVDSAVGNGDAVLACQALESIAELHDVPDLLRERANIVSKAATVRGTSDEIAWANTLLALSLADAAADLNRFDLANNLVRVGTVLSKPRSRAFKEKTVAFRKSVSVREKRQAAYKQALAKLKNQADDRDANLAAGRFELLVGGEWKAGAERWQRLAESALNELLTLEAKARRSSTERLAAARAWWNAASAADTAWKSDYQLQAKYWCLRAGVVAPVSSGGDRAWIADALSAPGYPHGRLRGGLATQLYNGEDFQSLRLERVDRNVDWTYGDRSPGLDVSPDHFSIRWTGWLKAPIPGNWRIIAHGDDGVRLWLDGKKVFDSWTVGERSEIQDVELDDALHSVRIEYNERWGPAYVDWSWCFIDGGEHGWQPVPPESLFYDPAAPYDWPSVK